MKARCTRSAAVGFLVLLLGAAVCAQNAHPRLLLTREEAGMIRSSLGKYPVLDRSFELVRRRADRALSGAAEVPVPRDAGGPIHQRHKDNYTDLQAAGLVYAVTGEERYARFVRDMLLQYAALWPTLGTHPMAASESHGRLFWQSLNETVWLVHAVQAYDCVYDWLSPVDRESIEKKLLRPMAEYMVTEHRSEFDRIHNHGTWTAAAVGMTGYAIGEKDFVEKSLYGSDKKGNGGFLRQLDLLFSPDGYYTEGPYYVRYAIMPFVLFAQVIENNQPGLKIFQYRDQILRKAFYSALQLTYTDGTFIPFNDGLKEKNFLSPEIILALNTIYGTYGGDPGLLWIARKHDEVIINGAGLSVARALAEADSIPPFAYASVEFRDGPNGDRGGVGLLRYGSVEDQSLLLMKYTSHGLSHGHYDKLAIQYYDQGREVLQDYGSARFINVEPKYGGRYLLENKTWAKQTVAHNTIVVDGKSHFDGKEEVSEKFPAERHFFSASNPQLQYVSAKAFHTYEGLELQRTAVMVSDERFPKPVVIDVLRVTSDTERQYDLPFYYLGHLINTNVRYTAHTETQHRLGMRNGYEHLWNEAEGSASGSVLVSWLNGTRYYSLVAAADSTMKVFFTRIGATDPNFNLRADPGVLMRKRVRSHVFAAAIVPHGLFDPVNEYSFEARPAIESVSVLATNAQGTIVEIRGAGELRWILMVNNGPSSETASHSITVGRETYRWTGNLELHKEPITKRTPE